MTIKMRLLLWLAGTIKISSRLSQQAAANQQHQLGNEGSIENHLFDNPSLIVRAHTLAPLGAYQLNVSAVFHDETYFEEKVLFTE